MTVIATYAMNDSRYIVCDRAVGGEDSQFQTATKIWNVQPGLVVGFAGESSTCNRIQFGTEVDPYWIKGYTMEWIYRTFVAPCVETFKELPEDKHAYMLIVAKNDVYYAISDGTLERVDGNFGIGSGGDLARVFLNFKHTFTDPYVLGKCLVSTVSEVCPSVSPHAVVQSVYTGV